MSLKEKAVEVLDIIETGGFHDARGQWVDIRHEIEFAVKNTRVYTPNEFKHLTSISTLSSSQPVIEVTGETTQIAASRMVNEGADDLVLLNFASARNPGGGFLNGAKAQEEDLTRCSSLYSCLTPQMTYYEANRAAQNTLYTDHIIYSPKVPWFRTRSRDAPDKVFYASVITAPAPNANVALQRGVGKDEIASTLHRRCGMVLGVAKDKGHKTILLGGWGCGVFGNEPAMVANSFKDWLANPAFSSAFSRVVFAIYSKGRAKNTLEAFKTCFTNEL